MADYKPKRRNLPIRGKKNKDKVLYDAETREIHVLNSTAFFIWELCDGQHSLEDMENLMRSKFSINEEQDVFQDIKVIVKSLCDKRLLNNAI